MPRTRAGRSSAKLTVVVPSTPVGAKAAVLGSARAAAVLKSPVGSARSNGKKRGFFDEDGPSSASGVSASALSSASSSDSRKAREYAAELDLDVESKVRLIRDMTDKLVADMRRRFELTLMALPDEVRSMPVTRFCTEFQGDLDRATSETIGRSARTLAKAASRSGSAPSSKATPLRKPLQSYTFTPPNQRLAVAQTYASKRRLPLKKPPPMRFGKPSTPSVTMMSPAPAASAKKSAPSAPSSVRASSSSKAAAAVPATPVGSVRGRTPAPRATMDPMVMTPMAGSGSHGGAGGGADRPSMVVSSKVPNPYMAKGSVRVTRSMARSMSMASNVSSMSSVSTRAARRGESAISMNGSPVLVEGPGAATGADGKVFDITVELSDMAYNVADDEVKRNLTPTARKEVAKQLQVMQNKLAGLLDEIADMSDAVTDEDAADDEDDDQ